jgi:hypothetical protein
MFKRIRADSYKHCEFVITSVLFSRAELSSSGAGRQANEGQVNRGTSSRGLYNDYGRAAAIKS